MTENTENPSEVPYDAERDSDADPDMLNPRAQGAEDAPLTIVEYASFTCGHCANFHANVYPQLKAEYIDTGKVRFVQRDVYFDQPGLWAGILARCGGDGITAHLREDRRHIRDDDLRRIQAATDLPLNLEMAASEEMLAIARNSRLLTSPALASSANLRMWSGTRSPLFLKNFITNSHCWLSAYYNSASGLHCQNRHG